MNCFIFVSTFNYARLVSVLWSFKTYSKFVGEVDFRVYSDLYCCRILEKEKTMAFQTPIPGQGKKQHRLTSAAF